MSAGAWLLAAIAGRLVNFRSFSFAPLRFGLARLVCMLYFAAIRSRLRRHTGGTLIMLNNVKNEKKAI